MPWGAGSLHKRTDRQIVLSIQHLGASFGKDIDSKWLFAIDTPHHQDQNSSRLSALQPPPPNSLCGHTHAPQDPTCSSPVPELILYSGRQTHFAETRCQHIPPCPLGISGPAAAGRQPWDPAVPTPTHPAHQHISPSSGPLVHPIPPPYCLCLCRQEAKRCEYINISLILSVPPKL